MIVVTGGAGFIGSNLVQGLNQRGYSNILIVDDLTDGRKFKNIVDCNFLDYLDKDYFLKKILHNEAFAEPITAIFHQGACSSTTEWNGRYLMEANYEYSKALLHYALNNNIPFSYASSAAIYGPNTVCKEHPDYEMPLNAYGFSKLQFDRYVRRYLTKATSQIMGFRYFNVYGPHETHKGDMVSVVQHFYNELQNNQTITIFNDIPNCPAGEQRRDFIYVKDLVNVLLWFFENSEHKKTAHKGIINLGTGQSISFNTIAERLINYLGFGSIRYQAIPAHLRDCYQVLTEADISSLRAMGFAERFRTLDESIVEYIPSNKAVIC